MRATIFNMNQVVMILIIFECVLFAFFLLLVNKGKRLSHTALGVFLLLNAAIALETLVYWNGPVKETLIDISPNLFFLSSFAFFLMGPVLLWYIKSRIYHKYSPARRDVLHLLPALLCIIFLIACYYSVEDTLKMLWLNDFSALMLTSWYQFLIWMQRVVVVAYGCLCLRELMLFQSYLKENFSNIHLQELNWLRLLVIGFLAIWAWQIVILCVQFITGLDNIAATMSTVSNYVLLVLINALVLYNLSQSSTLVGDISEYTIREYKPEETVSPYHVKLIEKLISEEKPYLDADITLDKMAEKISLSPRLLSMVINRHFKQNFFEYINYHRIEDAKKLLKDEDQPNLPVLEIMEKVGFKSKSAFNLFFKRFVGMTPSQYRRRA